MSSAFHYQSPPGRFLLSCRHSHGLATTGLQCRLHMLMPGAACLVSMSTACTAASRSDACLVQILCIAACMPKAAGYDIPPQLQRPVHEVRQAAKHRQGMPCPALPCSGVIAMQVHGQRPGSCEPVQDTLGGGKHAQVRRASAVGGRVREAGDALTVMTDHCRMPSSSRLPFQQLLSTQGVHLC